MSVSLIDYIFPINFPNPICPTNKLTATIPKKLCWTMLNTHNPFQQITKNNKAILILVHKHWLDHSNMKIIMKTLLLFSNNILIILSSAEKLINSLSFHLVIKLCLLTFTQYTVPGDFSYRNQNLLHLVFNLISWNGQTK